MDQIGDLACLSIEAFFIAIISDIGDFFSQDLFDIYFRFSGDLSCDNQIFVGNEHFTRYPAQWILFQTSVQNTVSKLIADFVRMSLQSGFTGDEMFHDSSNKKIRHIQCTHFFTYFNDTILIGKCIPKCTNIIIE